MFACTCTAGVLTAGQQNAAEVRNRMSRNMMWLATGRGRADAGLSAITDEPSTRPRQRRRLAGLRVRRETSADDDYVDVVGQYLADYEQNIDLHRRRRPAVDPTLLMMGIGRRK